MLYLKYDNILFVKGYSPNDYRVDLGLEEFICQNKVGKPFMMGLLDITSIERYVSLAYFDREIEDDDYNPTKFVDTWISYHPIGYSLIIGPITRDDIDTIEYNEMIFYPIDGVEINKYKIMLDKYPNINQLYWREFTCVMEKYNKKNRPDLDIARYLRSNIEKYVRRSKTGKAMLVVETEYDRLVQFLLEDGFKLSIDKGIINDSYYFVKFFV